MCSVTDVCVCVLCAFLDVWCIMFYDVYHSVYSVQHLLLCIPLYEIQCGFVHKRGAIDAVFILRIILREESYVSVLLT